MTPTRARIRQFLEKDREEDRLRQGILILRALRDRLESGQVPSREEWNGVQRIPDPWGQVFSATLAQARDRGAPVLGSLDRMQRLLEDQVAWIGDAKSKVAPAQGQALLSLSLAPLFALAVFLLLPGLEKNWPIFLGVTWTAVILGWAAYLWISDLAEQAQYGGLRGSKKTWIASAQVSIERWISWVQVGLPPDLAWTETIQELHRTHPELALRWGTLVWSEMEQDSRIRKPSVQSSLEMVGLEMRRLIQTSLIEGQGVLERVEALQRTWMQEIRAQILRDLALLPQKSLKPLFALVLPAVVMILATAVGLSVDLSGNG